jgi:hypothetical protein
MAYIGVISMSNDLYPRESWAGLAMGRTVTLAPSLSLLLVLTSYIHTHSLALALAPMALVLADAIGPV